MRGSIPKPDATIVTSASTASHISATMLMYEIFMARNALAACLISSAVAKPVTLRPPSYRFDPDELHAAITPKTKWFLLNSPSNPTGAVFSPEQITEIGRWALEHGIWVITDEIYEHLTYGPHQFSSMPVLVPDIAEQCLILNGVAKTYAMTGWRVGWLIGPLICTLTFFAWAPVATSRNSALITPITELRFI